MYKLRDNNEHFAHIIYEQIFKVSRESVWTFEEILSG